MDTDSPCLDPVKGRAQYCVSFQCNCQSKKHCMHRGFILKQHQPLEWLLNKYIGANKMIIVGTTNNKTESIMYQMENENPKREKKTCNQACTSTVLKIAKETIQIPNPYRDKSLK